MHRSTAVAELSLDEDIGYILKIGDVFAPEHLPVGVGMKKGIADRAALNEWWMDRSIPSSRSVVREAMETLQIEDTR
ncbi:MAG: excisionase, partial [Oscillospiraceae bacterium]|nr:excisionase [Oscillospiraceae bacterium]